MLLQNTKEAIARLTIVAAVGVKGGSKTFKPMNGTVVGCSIYYNGGNSPGFTGAMIKDAAGRELSMLQSIDNYRNREAAYHEGYKPFYYEACGDELTLEVQATEDFASDLTAELILYYKQETQQ